MDDLEDLICDALQDSMDIDWTCRVGAKAVAKVVAAELSRLSALVAWQDIETAPKDGTRILIEFVHANAKFSPDPVGEGWIAVHEAYWLDHNAGGWTWYGLSGVATRWLPLPTPPVSQLKDTTNADK